MQRKNEDTYKIFHGMKPVKRQVRRDNQSGWYYLDPRGAENFSDMKEIGVESENSPNPKIKAILDDDMHKNPDDYYVWRTKKDDKVRDSHREREGKVFNWHVPPEGGHPGEDHNCRCWAEAYRPDLMAHLNITPKVDLSGLPQYAANDKTGLVSDAKYVSAENDKVEAQDKNAVAVPVPTSKPEVPAQTTAKKIVPVPTRKPLTGQGLAEEMLRRYVERAPEAGLKLAAADYKNGYTTESVWGYPNVGYDKGGVANKTKKIDYSLYGEGFTKEFIDEMENDYEFQQILNEYIIPNEGGYNNDPNDAGGETNMGIAKNAHPKEDINNLTRERANAIYYKDYYKWNGLNKLPYQIRGFVVDYGLPTNPQYAIKTVHNVLGISKDATVIGPTTLEAFEHYTDADYNAFLEQYRAEMKKHFKDVAQKNPQKRKFLNGWLNRADRAHLAK